MSAPRTQRADSSQDSIQDRTNTAPTIVGAVSLLSSWSDELNASHAMEQRMAIASHGQSPQPASNSDRSAALVVPSPLMSPPDMAQFASKALRSAALVVPSKFRSLAQHCPQLMRAAFAQRESHEVVQQNESFAHTAAQHDASLHAGAE